MKSLLLALSLLTSCVAGWLSPAHAQESIYGYDTSNGGSWSMHQAQPGGSYYGGTSDGTSFSIHPFPSGGGGYNYYDSNGTSMTVITPHEPYNPEPTYTPNQFSMPNSTYYGKQPCIRGSTRC